jgi:hypothetical protein
LPNLSLERNHNTMVLDHTFYIWIYNIVMFPKISTIFN